MVTAETIEQILLGQAVVLQTENFKSNRVLYCAIYDTIGNPTTRYVYSPRGIHAMENNAGDWSYPLADGLNSNRVEVDANLGIDASGSYQPYGVPFDVNSTFNLPHRFTGEILDEGVGLQHHRARDYAPALGIFPSLDPFEGLHDRPMSLNGYSWVEGNVPNRVDNTGKCTRNATSNDFQKNYCSYMISKFLEVMLDTGNPSEFSDTLLYLQELTYEKFLHQYALRTLPARIDAYGICGLAQQVSQVLLKLQFPQQRPMTNFDNHPNIPVSVSDPIYFDFEEQIMGNTFEGTVVGYTTLGVTSQTIVLNPQLLERSLPNGFHELSTRTRIWGMPAYDMPSGQRNACKEEVITQCSDCWATAQTNILRALNAVFVTKHSFKITPFSNEVTFFSSAADGRSDYNAYADALSWEGKGLPNPDGNLEECEPTYQ